jgi:RHH-type proline utilization regulon transcriptional repressor/proline dehydrogenase/delta 1-pyrroline-5-carboxylate dehydrogenase
MLQNISAIDSIEPPDSSAKPQLPMLLKLWEQLDNSSRLLLNLPDVQANDLLKLRVAILAYDRYAREEIALEHDHFRLVGQDNNRRYLPVSPIHLRFSPGDSCWGLLARCAAAIAVNGSAIVSIHPAVDHQIVETIEKLTLNFAGKLEFIEQSDQQLVEAIENGEVQRLRYDGAEDVPDSIRRTAPKNFVFIADQSVSLDDHELLWYVLEQSVSFDYHRYGNLGPRSEEPRSPVL